MNSPKGRLLQRFLQPDSCALSLLLWPLILCNSLIQEHHTKNPEVRILILEGKAGPMKILLIWLLASQDMFAVLQTAFCKTFFNIILMEEILNPVNNNTACMERAFTTKRVNKNFQGIKSFSLWLWAHHVGFKWLLDS